MALTNQELLERIAPYLPYGLKFYHKRMDSEPTSLYELVAIQKIGDDLDFQFGGDHISNSDKVMWKSDLVPLFQIDGFPSWVKPILRPLSDLTKPCLEGGKVPMVELIKYVYNHKYYLVDTSIKNNTCIVRFKPNQFDSTMYFLDVDIDEFGVSYGIEHEVDKNGINNDRYLPVNDIIGIMKFLFKNHFDIHNLIGSGYAIDINTLSDE